MRRGYRARAVSSHRRWLPEAEHGSRGGEPTLHPQLESRGAIGNLEHHEAADALPTCDLTVRRAVRPEVPGRLLLSDLRSGEPFVPAVVPLVQVVRNLCSVEEARLQGARVFFGHLGEVLP